MQRQSELQNWLHSLYPDRPFELAFAAADADFRRYFRATFSDSQTIICMDAPPDKMSIAPYLKVQKLFSMLNVPQVYHADETLGFAALSDLGSTTYLAAMQHDGSGTAHKALLLEAIDELIVLQKASRPDVLPPYDREVMLREINLFPDWFAAKELGKPFNFKQKQLWQQVADVLLPPLLAQPQMFVHRDYIVRNLMLSAGRCCLPAGRACLISKTPYTARFPTTWYRCCAMPSSNGKKNSCWTWSSATGKKPAPQDCPFRPNSTSSTAGSNGWAYNAI